MGLEGDVNNALKDKKPFSEKAKGWLVDTVTNTVFWQPITAIAEYGFMGYTLDEMLSARTGNFAFAVTTGAIYCQAINLGRYCFNRGYYNQEIHGVKREKNWFTNIKDYIVDVGTTSVYWNIVMGGWLHYVSDFPWDRVKDAAIDYTALYLLVSWPFGKFLNFARRKFKTVDVKPT